MAAKWNVDSSVLLSVNYSDNIELVGEYPTKTDLITVLKPSMVVNAKGRRLEIDADYFLQITDYTKRDTDKTILYGYKIKAKVEPIRETLFLDVRASRQLIANSGSIIEANNRLLKNDISNVDTYIIKPSYESVISGATLVELVYSYTNVSVKERDLEDHKESQVIMNLSNIKRDSRLEWKLASLSSVIKRDNQRDAERSTNVLNIKYQLTKNIRYVAVLGYESNTIDSLTDGSYQAVGLGWVSSNRFELDLFSGRDLQRVALVLRPTNRVSLKATWTDTVIGLQSDKLVGSFDLDSKYFYIQASHFEDVTTFQQLLSENQQSGQLNTSLPNSDAVFLRYGNVVSISTKRPKLNFKLDFTTEKRQFIEEIAGQPNLDSDTEIGTATLFWKKSSRFIISFVYGLEKISADNSDKLDKLKFSALDFSYNSNKNLAINARIKKTQMIAGQVGSIDFIENNVRMNLIYSF